MKSNSSKLSIVKLALAASLLVSPLTFSGCSTTKGFGQDLQKLGQEIQQEADEHL